MTVTENLRLLRAFEAARDRVISAAFDRRRDTSHPQEAKCFLVRSKTFPDFSSGPYGQSNASAIAEALNELHPSAQFYIEDIESADQQPDERRQPEDDDRDG